MTEKRMIFIFQIVIAIGGCALLVMGMHEVYSSIAAKLALVKV